MSDGILQGLDPQAIAEHFGEVDMEYTWDAEPLPVPVCLQVKTCNGAAILELEKRIAELERERDTMGAVLAAQSRNAVINGGTPTLTERAQTKRIAELEAERDALQKNLSSTEAFYAASKERAEQAEKERDAAIADARRLLELFRRQAIRSFIAGAGNTYFGLRGKSLSPTDIEYVANIAERRFPYVAESFATDKEMLEFTALMEKYGGAK